MILWKDINLKIEVSDIETLACAITIGFYNPDSRVKTLFEISEYKNDLYSFVKFYTTENIDYVVGFNYRNFDAQVLQFIVNEHEKWFDKNNLEIVEFIYKFTQSLIDNQNYHLALPYREYQFVVPVIDMFLIFGLDGEARRTSLKAAAFQTDGTVEEMPIHHSVKKLTREELDMVESYMFNDINETYRDLLIAIGQTEIKSYKGTNQIELRVNIKDEFGVDCMNLSDIKIGEEILKKDYAKQIKKEIKELPRKGTFRKEIQLKRCIPSYVKFETKQLQDLLKLTKSKVIKQTEDFENEFIFGKTKYVQGLGGLHSVNLNEIWEAKDDFIINDDDVSSFYPKMIIDNNYYPYHLGKELLIVYKSIYQKRIDLKPLSKTDKKIKGIVEALKLVLNSVFGKLGSMESWLYDKQTLLSVTLTGQFTLLMLAEMFESAGIRVISANTDGLTTYFHKDLLAKKQEIVKKWQEITTFEIETVSFKKFVYSTVNDYLAIKESGEVKYKGDLEVADLLYKNKSNSIIPLALQAYFEKGIKPEEFVNSHKNIYDFVARAKSSKNFHYEGINEKTGEKTVYNKLIRYYISTEGEKLLKIKNEECDTNAAKVSQVNAGDFQSIVCNEITNPEEHLKRVNRQWFIDKINTSIIKIEYNRKLKKEKFINPLQQSLF